MKRLRLAALTIISAPIALASAATVNMDHDFPANSQSGRSLLAAATISNDGDANTARGNAIFRDLEDMGSDFVGDYSIKFQNCHQVTQWTGSERNAQQNNNDADNDDDNDDDNDNDNEDDASDDGQSKIRQKRLVRFRLCPASSCVDNSDTGCSSKFGDYLVDISTFMYYYLSAQAESNQDIANYCSDQCDDGDDAIDDNSGSSGCYTSCYSDQGGVTFEYGAATSDDDGALDLDPVNYATCTEFDSYYLGPHCADDGGKIHLGIFSDDECTSFSACGESCFYKSYGFNLPYSSSSSTSMVSSNCLSCADGTFRDGKEDYDESTEPKQECQKMYASSGKCESRMYIDYPNESACTYIEGLKYLGNDGVINSGSGKKNKEVGVVIGLMLFSSVLLVVYVYFLQQKFERAKFHLGNGSNAALG